MDLDKYQVINSNYGNGWNTNLKQNEEILPLTPCRLF